MTALTTFSNLDAPTLIRRERRRWMLTYASAGFLSLTVIFFSLFSPHVGFPVAAALYLLGALAMLLRPVFGIYAITVVGLLADNSSAPWWPFLKNASSPESVLYVSDAAIVSPLEGYLVILTLGVALQIALRQLEFQRPLLLAPLGAFMFFMMVGLVWGIGRGGNINIALWEIRPFAALVVVYLFGTTLIQTRTQAHILGWLVIAAIFFESVRTVFWYVGNDEAKLFDSLVEHSAASHMNLVFIMAIVAWLVNGYGLGRRMLLPLLSAPVAWVYLISERRSAIAALILCIGIAFVFLAKSDVRRFWQIGPVLLVLAVGYTIVFWSAAGPLGFPAGVVKAQISPEAANASDQASDLYRKIEHFNIIATVERNPLLGVGFGQQYDRPIPLPDISLGFVWWEYMTHNAIMWIWLKAGFFGFVAMFNFLGRGLFLGMRTALGAKDPADKVIAITATLFVPAYTIYSYVDISWGTQSLILLAVCLTMLGRLHEETAVAT